MFCFEKKDSNRFALPHLPVPHCTDQIMKMDGGSKYENAYH
jgi:hypothetical protein